MALEITIVKDYNLRVTVKQLTFADPEINQQIDDDEDSEDTRVEGTIDVYQNPFGNCQTFCIAYGYHLNSTGDDPESVRLILRSTLEAASMKKQGLFDLNAGQVEQFIKNISPWALAIHQMPYESTNGSHMVLILVQLDVKNICK